MIKYVINLDNSYGGAFTSLEDGINFTDFEPKNPTDIWNGSTWVDNSPIVVPKEISRMKFEMQVLLTTGIEWDGIIAYIIDLSMSELYKKLLLIRLKRCVTLKREDNDLNTIAFMMGITQQQLDEIFINGNLLD